MRRDDVGGADGRKVGADSSIREVTLFSPGCMSEVRQNREFGLGSRFCCPCGSQIPWTPTGRAAASTSSLDRPAREMIYSVAAT